MVYISFPQYFTSFMYILLRNIDLEFNFQSYINIRTLLLFLQLACMSTTNFK